MKRSIRICSELSLALPQKRYEDRASVLPGAPSGSDFMNRQAFHLYCRMYIRWLRCDYGTSFTCPRFCGTLSTAPIIIADGTPLGANAVFAKSTTFPAHESVPIRRDQPARTGSLFADRCIIRPPILRQQVTILCNTPAGSAEEVSVSDEANRPILV